MGCSTPLPARPRSTSGRPCAAQRAASRALLEPAVKHRRARFILVVIGCALTLLLVTDAWRWFWKSTLQVAELVQDRYGIDLPVAVALFGLGEVLFCGSIAMMLKEAGQQATWKSIRTFNIRELNLGNRRILWWLWVNRLSWSVPWLIVVAMSFGRVPWVATIAALGEVVVTLGIGVLLSLGLRLPWWNQDGGKRMRKPKQIEKASIRVARLRDVTELVAFEHAVWGGGGGPANGSWCSESPTFPMAIWWL